MTSAAGKKTLWYTRCPVPTPLGLAARQQWFENEFSNEGIEINTLQETQDLSLRESHYDHRLPFSFRQGGNVPAIWAKSRGAQTRVIGLNWVDEAQLIITLPSSGINVLEDLKGRKLGLPKNNNSIDHARAGALKGFLVALDEARIGRTEVDFVDVVSKARLPGSGWFNQDNTTRSNSYSELFEALFSGVVDAIYVKGARGLEAVKKYDAKVLYDLRQNPDPIKRANNGAPRPITVDLELIEQHPDWVLRFLRKIVEVGDWAKTNAEKTVAYIANESGSSAEWVRQAYGADIHLKQGTTLDSYAIQALSSYKDFLYQEGFIPSDFNVDDWIEPRFLTQIFLQQRQAA
jgi:ABC-type nitrate/sulfonate/bicarbonate transport system substrate-binding protein